MQSRSINSANSRRPCRHRAMAVMETVIVLNVLLFMAFGLVEFGQYFYIKHCFEAAARDASRIAILSNATQAQITSALTTSLAQANVTYNPSWLTITDLGPASTGTVTDVASVAMGDTFQLKLSATYGSLPNALRPLNQMTGVGISSTKTVVGFCTMVKE